MRYGYNYSKGNDDLLDGSKKIINDEPDYLPEDDVDKEPCNDTLCEFYDERGFCLFESCILDELPIMHKSWYRKCDICKEVYVVKQNSTHQPFTHICESCRRGLEDLLLNNKEFKCALCGGSMTPTHNSADFYLHPKYGYLQLGNRQTPGLNWCDHCMQKARAAILPVEPCAGGKYYFAKWRYKASPVVNSEGMNWMYTKNTEHPNGNYITQKDFDPFRYPENGAEENLGLGMQQSMGDYHDKETQQENLVNNRCKNKMNIDKEWDGQGW